MRADLLLRLLLLVAVFGACAPNLPAPEVSTVSPTRGWSGAETVVRIGGDRFYPQVVVDAGRRGAVDVDRDFRAWLSAPGGGERYALSGVGALDYQSLQGVIPAGFAEGTYDLTVVGPSGGSDTLFDAFQVTSSQVDRFSLDALSVVATVNDLIFLRLNTLDPAGAPVVGEEEVPVRITARGVDLAGLVWAPGSLVDQRVSQGGAVLEGVVRDGRALVGLTVPTPQDITLDADPGAEGARISSDRATVRFESGAITTLDVALPSTPSPFEVVAGASFPVTLTLRDTFGNPVADVREVVLAFSCGGLLRRYTVAGTLEIDIAVNVVTGTPGCPEGRIISVSPVGESDTFTVLPGAVTSLRLQTSTLDVVAGVPFNVFVTSLDAFGNPTSSPQLPTISADPVPVSVTGCVPAAGVAWSCQVTATVATANLTLEAADFSGATGTATNLVVSPSPILGDLTLTAPATLVAGEPSPFFASASDIYGNVVAGASLATLLVVDELDEAICAFVGEAVDGTAELTCTSLTARDSASFVAVSDSGALSSPPAVASVLNGPLRSVLIEPSALEVASRAELTVVIRGFDAFGNAYLVQSDAALSLQDTTGSLAPTLVELGADGVVEVAVTFQAPGLTSILASQAGLELGASAVIHVTAGPAIALTLSTAEPWAFVDEGVRVSLQAVDADGFATTFDGVGLLQSDASLGPPVAFLLVNGMAEAVWVPTAAADVALLLATAGALSGQVVLVAVPERCADGPEIAVAANASSQGRACTDPASGQADVQIDDIGTLGDVARWLVAPELVSVESATLPVTAAVHGAGRRTLSVLGVDADRCGDVGEAVVWLGEDDGGPVGPLAWQAGPTLIIGTVGSASLASVVGCDGAPADGEIFVRADRGVLTGATATGGGLVASVVGGAASLGLDLTLAQTGGQARLVAWRAGSLAYGEASVIVDGDVAPPTVWRQEPAGVGAGVIDTISVTFSEAIDATRFDEASATLSGPDAPAVTAISQGPSADAVIIALDAPLDAANGPFTLALGGIYDLAGNELDGAWSASPSDWAGRFGASTQPPAVVCSAPSVPSFRPDGDDGPGADADAVSVSIGASAVPARWRAEVIASDASLIDVEVWPATSIEATWSWDGRDATQRVVEAGAYQLRLMAEDGLGGVGEACSVAVTLTQVGAP